RILARHLLCADPLHAKSSDQLGRYVAKGHARSALAAASSLCGYHCLRCGETPQPAPIRMDFPGCNVLGHGSSNRALLRRNPLRPLFVVEPAYPFLIGGLSGPSFHIAPRVRLLVDLAELAQRCAR